MKENFLKNVSLLIIGLILAFIYLYIGAYLLFNYTVLSASWGIWYYFLLILYWRISILDINLNSK